MRKRWRKLARCGAAGALLLLVAAAADTAAAWPPEIDAVLRSGKMLYVASQRKDGSRSRAAPVWFGVLDGELWINTKPTSYKARRTKLGRLLYVAPREEGPFTTARGEIVADGKIADRLGDLYRHRYWLAWLGMFRPNAKRLAAGEIVLIRLTPKD